MCKRTVTKMLHRKPSSKRIFEKTPDITELNSNECQSKVTYSDDTTVQTSLQNIGPVCELGTHIEVAKSELER